MPADPHPGTPAVNTLADATKLRAQLDTVFKDVIQRGKSIIDTDQSTNSTSYTTLATPDQVASLVLPTESLIAVLYQADMRGDGAGNGRAAIFIGSNQLKVTPLAGGVPIVQEAATGDANERTPCVSVGCGLSSTNVTASIDNPVTTGQAVAYEAGATGPCYIFAAAGTYTVSIKFKCTSGSMSVLNRKLWVWVSHF